MRFEIVSGTCHEVKNTWHAKVRLRSIDPNLVMRRDATATGTGFTPQGALNTALCTAMSHFPDRKAPARSTPRRKRQ